MTSRAAMYSAKLSVEQPQFVNVGVEQRDLPAGESSTKTPGKLDTSENVDSTGTNPSKFPWTEFELTPNSEIQIFDHKPGRNMVNNRVDKWDF